MKYVADPTEASHYSVTELRVHGVGGESPEEMLGVPHVHRVAGTKRAGFYRSPKWITLDGPDRNLEGYSWGGITSSSRLRALWIILLPFALINLAGWMIPQSGSAARPTARSRTDAMTISLYRLFGLAASVAAVTFGSMLLIEFVALGCACTDRWYLAPWRLAGNEPQRIVVGASMAAATLLVLAFVARLGQASKHEIDKTERSDPAGQTTFVGSGNGPRTEIWQRPDVADRLGLAHTSVSLAVIGLMLIEALALVSAESLRLGTGILVGLAAIAVIQASVVSVSASRVNRLVLAGVAGVTLWTLVEGWKLSALPNPLTDLTIVPFSVFAAFGGLFVVTALATAGRRWFAGIRPSATDDDQRIGWIRFLSPVSVLGAAALLIVAVGAGLLGVTADILDLDVALNEVNRFAVPGLLWFVEAIPMGLFVYFTATSRTSEDIAADYDLTVTSSRDRRFVSGVQRAEKIAAVTDRLDWILFGGLMGALIGLVFFRASWMDTLTPLAERVVLVLPVLGVGLIAWMIREPTARRGFGVIWDVSTFWPRWYHPFAPPSYAEFAVPHLKARIESLAPTPVVLSTHSQGSVIGAAALAGTQPDDLAHVRWISHGCPLDRLYATYFGEYFDADLFEDLRIALAEESWCNLWRRTDYIGGSVAASVDRMIRDPETAESLLSIDERPRPSRHSDFYSTDAYLEVFTEFAD